MRRHLLAFAVGRRATGSGDAKWIFEIPFATPQGTAMAHFDIARDAGPDQCKAKAATVANGDGFRSRTDRRYFLRYFLLRYFLLGSSFGST